MFWLLAWAAFTRLPLIISGIIPFSFDHGRDSLAVLHFIKTLNPVFLGPWTSIPGLFFGPGWYYLLAPAYFLVQGNPVAGAWIMFFVGLLELISEIAKIISFAFRLFGNIFAGEVLLAVIGSLAALVVPMPFYGLEIFVGFIQALVFAMLSVVFFNMATLGHSDH